MYKRPHHQRILKVLQSFNGRLLEEHECFFGGGTAIVLLLGEYRESVDIDLLCASAEGYRGLREIAHTQGVSGFFAQPPKPLRDLRADRYGIRTFIEVDDMPIKFEIVREDRIPLTGKMHSLWGIPVLSREEMYAEKLLANADRYADIAVASRDIIDIAMMTNAWGEVPPTAWQKATKAYGESVRKAFFQAIELVSGPAYLMSCLSKLHMDEQLLEQIPRILATYRR